MELPLFGILGCDATPNDHENSASHLKDSGGFVKLLKVLNAYQLQLHSSRPVPHRHGSQVITRHGACEERSRRRLRLDHSNVDDIDLGESREQSLNGDKGVIATLLEEYFVALTGRQVAIPRMHVARAPLD
jgi:hypothetical protein